VEFQLQSAVEGDPQPHPRRVTIASRMLRGLREAPGSPAGYPTLPGVKPTVGACLGVTELRRYGRRAAR
jgi:hypothetical protein